MAHPYHHAQSSARKYGGEPSEYLRLHEWLDASKSHMADFRHVEPRSIVVHACRNALGKGLHRDFDSIAPGVPH